MKWTQDHYKSQFQKWTPPRLIYPVSDTERETLHALKSVFDPLPIYPNMERHPSEQPEPVQIDTPIPDGYIAFLENTAEQCTSPTTKHSQEGMQGARHWVQRVDTPDGMFQRLTDGYGVSLMFGERHYQYIRNSNNWRGVVGCMLDLDVWYEQPDTLKKKLEADDRDADFIAKRLAENEKLPQPCYSQSELFDRYPLIPRICTYLIPSASSLYEDRPFKARGIILFPTPLTDQRIYRAFGDILCSELDCIPANVTKNPVAVGFGNTHNAPQAYRNADVDMAWITDKLANAQDTALTVATKRNKERKHKAKLREHYKKNGVSGQGENIREFIETCDAIGEMVRDGLLTRGRGNEYRWHESQNDRSCELMGDGVLHIFSWKMDEASPAGELEPVNVHRFYLYQLTGLDLARKSDQAKCREYLFERGYGRDPKAQAKAKAKLKKNDDESEPTETLAENREKQEKATDTFLETETETLHCHLKKADTGTGKTRLILTKAAQHEKRTLGQYPHNDLARQAVDTAFDCGYKNPYHLLGREHNWDDSGIAKIPVNMRTADLFEKNNCIMVDEVETYTENNVAARIYCEHKCPFRKGCLHLAQYEGLGERDFIATCTPNLLFDLDFRGYLISLVTATSEPTDEELAIDAALGTESKATEHFDFAIIDDYGVSGLYSDVCFAENKFKELKKVWHGTPTARFAKRILKAFEKKKPHKIVKALRNALESTAEHHAEIAESLTQHARLGTVETLDRPKGSKESKRALSEKRVVYDDGGMQFIPVDEEAYKELKEKNIPVIHLKHLETQENGDRIRVPHTPTHAIIVGIPVEQITPVWQRGATPIELLQIFLDSLGNDKNAPITRRFRVGDPPEAVLTFSVPPQAPVGILPQIAMLSATTDPEAVKEAFAGQNVTFSVHEGGNVEWADGVQVYQFTDARLTSASVFEYPQETDGKRKLQETPTGLTQTAENRLTKLNDWAKAVDGVTAFISYKEFTDTPFSEAVDGFDIVTHFDKVSGLNFDGLKFLVVFGYPKVKHEVVMEHARVQFARDTEPLPKADPKLLDDNGKPIGEYMQLTEDVTATENGLEITERRYKDPRLEKIRHQLATEKLDQSLGRARFPVWTDTLTIAFTDAPIARITERATLFSRHAFNLAETPSALSEAMDRIEKAEQTGDVKAVMEAKGVSKRTAEYQTKPARDARDEKRDAEIIRLHEQELSLRKIAEKTTYSFGTVSRVVKAYQKRKHQLVPLIGTCVNGTPPTKSSDPCLESESPKKSVNSNGNVCESSKERPRPEWHDNDYYSETAIRERLKRQKSSEISNPTTLESDLQGCEISLTDPEPDREPDHETETPKLNGESIDTPQNLHTTGNGISAVDTTEQKHEVNRLYASGTSKAEIHRVTGVDFETIDTWLADNLF